jgi:hypothetical protein
MYDWTRANSASPASFSQKHQELPLLDHDGPNGLLSFVIGGDVQVRAGERIAGSVTAAVDRDLVVGAHMAAVISFHRRWQIAARCW